MKNTPKEITLKICTLDYSRAKCDLCGIDNDFDPPLDICLDNNTKLTDCSYLKTKKYTEVDK